MKIVNYIGIVIALIAIGIGYVNYQNKPSEPTYNSSLSDEANMQMNQEWSEAHSNYVDTGAYVMFAGILAFLLCVIAAIKTKDKLAYLGVLISLVAFFLGAATGTHMFS